MLTVQSSEFAAGDNRDQMAHIPASHSSQGLYPPKNELIRWGNETFRRSFQQIAASAATSMIGTKLQ
jgi:hypothetical protein